MNDAKTTHEVLRQTDPTLPDGSLNLSGNLPPIVADVFEERYRRALSKLMRQEQLSSLVGSHRFTGTENDRRAGSVFVSLRLGLAPDVKRVVVTNGTQSAIDRLFDSIAGRGGVIAAEELTYPAIKPIATRLGIRLCPVRIDGDGIMPDSFSDVCQRERPSAFYTLPTLHNPTTATTTLVRRRAIVDIARLHNVQFIEDDIYSILPLDAPPPFATLAPEISWYILGTAKSLSPGLKVAYVVAPDGVAAGRVFWPGVKSTYWMPAPLNAETTANLVLSGDVKAIIGAVRLEMSYRHELAREILDGIPVTTRPGALNLWVRMPTPGARLEIAKLTQSRNVIVGTGDAFVVGDCLPPEALRIGLGTVLTRDQLSRGLEVLREAYRSVF
ncbi:aminotransferase class I/II-fold pyridoxal phosphate-dependent enzyme [Bradyrhizobium sp. CSA112]|uniref:aminotransferase-like domain-containing protein n=1 Tax=Bradyrhizobium sp. CSA112 TaxID=2699170 RepID=UPI0023B1DC8B|nr:PLP-dependent aminotransferase family protein [Bradyrhizobium sp. CSA112]MDE5457569.1 aminotransferase class I/II-fold pyridoxal phosphate-dependent enzyme [Bradyrhizobium sp. CSA112]